jgi:hypothetical protein
MIHFQCPECGFGDREIGEMAEAEIYCMVCLEEQGRETRVHCWTEPDQALLRDALLAA